MTDENGTITPVTAVTVSEPLDSKPLTASDIKAQVTLIQQVMEAVMQEGFHYGVIPGTQKPTLLKPGAEKLIVTFRLAPLLNVERIELADGHREYQVKCTLVHIPTGRVFGEGIGSCSTREAKYRYRQSERLCPHCGKATIIKGKAEYGGGWLCFAKKGGCGAKFADRDEQITEQPVGRVENPDLADIYNTILKMAKKRALVDATLTATAASDIFTQDMEDLTPSELQPVVPLPPTPGLGGEPVTLPSGPPSASPPLARESKLLTKGQLELLQLAIRREKITEPLLLAHLQATYGVRDIMDLKQGQVNGVLEWLEQIHAQTEQPIPAAPPDRPLTTMPKQEGMLTLKQWNELKEVAEMCHIPERVFKAYLKRQGWADRFSIPVDKLDTILEWCRANQDDVP
jgi:hypothetical protein